MSSSHPGTAAAHHEPNFLRKYIFSEDHKIIGIQFLFSSIIMFLIGGSLALLVRIQLGWPHAEIPSLGQWLWPSNGGRMDPAAYTMLFSMHATIMIFFVIIPMLVGGFANFTIPL